MIVIAGEAMSHCIIHTDHDRLLRNLLLRCRDGADMNRTFGMVCQEFGESLVNLAVQAELIRDTDLGWPFMSITDAGRAKLAEFAPRPEALAFAKLMLPNSETRIGTVAAQLDDLISDIVGRETPDKLSVSDLSTALRRHPVAVCIMNGEDVLSEFGLSEIDESEEQHDARLAKADDWLADNRDQIEDAMSRAGFEAIGIVGDGPAEFKIGPMPE